MRIQSVMVAVIVFLTNGPVYAGIVSDRATLNSLLAGYVVVTESFETLSLPPAENRVIPPVLNFSTPDFGYGTGLVAPGVTFLDPASIGLQWNSVGYCGQPSQDLVSDGGTLDVEFAIPTTAFGLDLRNFAGFNDSASVKVYGPDDKTLLASYSGIDLSSPDEPVFFGYEDPGGIGMVAINGIWQWTPIIDNVTFDPPSVVPEPSALALAALGTAALLISRRRK
jgi:hypothetical protein